MHKYEMYHSTKYKIAKWNLIFFSTDKNCPFEMLMNHNNRPSQYNGKASLQC